MPKRRLHLPRFDIGEFNFTAHIAVHAFIILSVKCRIAQSENHLADHFNFLWLPFDSLFRGLSTFKP
jgi:hypothetical protein